MAQISLEGGGARLRDPFGRVVDSLRISLTQRCNFECFFCHREGEHDPHGEMAPEEVEGVVALASELGFEKVKLTGGEPLLREDAVEIVRRVAALIPEVSMTTNASLLAERARDLREAGLRRVNVSFHSLRPDVFRRITGNGSQAEVEEGVRAAVDCGLIPVKLNVVVLRGLNSEEIPEMIDYSKKAGAILQLIEYQPLERGVEGWGEHHYDLSPVEEELASRSERVVERDLHRRRQYHLEGGGVVEVVRPMHNSRFCKYCTRLRLTSDGRLKPCLMRDDNLVDIVGPIRRGEPREALFEAFREAVARREPYWRERV